MANNKHIPIAGVLVLAIGAAGCGARAAHRAEPTRDQVVNLTADPSGNYDFIPKSLTARPGKLTIELSNPPSSFTKHGIAVEGNGVRALGPAAPRGGTARLTVTLRSGRYRVFSPVNDQARKGMTAKLYVHGPGSTGPRAREMARATTPSATP